MNLELKKFDMSSIKDDRVVVLIGKRDTGKSFLVKDLLFYHQNLPIGTVISATESANSFYGYNRWKRQTIIKKNVALN